LSFSSSASSSKNLILIVQFKSAVSLNFA